MLFAEPGHPYDDFEDPPEWAWRFGYFELLYTRSIKTLTLSRGPKYSVRSKYCCRLCHGSGYLPWRESAPEERDTPQWCPTCPTRSTWFKDVPLWPVCTLDRLHTRLRKHRRAADNSVNPWHAPGPIPGPTDAYVDEPPF
ncbi:hypothetical protein ACFVYG_20185 [Streptomyces sp. NPDC058256]|uniref:hypothetical protein n=1 Tax=Streptomyces sp. NPDC058256 TaxID=3346408 RepID=UPI0036E1D9F3